MSSIQYCNLRIRYTYTQRHTHTNMHACTHTYIHTYIQDDAETCILEGLVTNFFAVDQNGGLITADNDILKGGFLDNNDQ